MDRSRALLGLLQDAREMVRDDWGTCNVDAPWERSHGRHCASVSIIEAANAEGFHSKSATSVAAHIFFLRGAGVNVPANEDQVLEAVCRFNDAQVDRRAVVAAFDKALAIAADDDVTARRGAQQLATVELRQHLREGRLEVPGN